MLSEREERVRKAQARWQQSNTWKECSNNTDVKNNILAFVVDASICKYAPSLKDASAVACQPICVSISASTIFSIVGRFG